LCVRGREGEMARWRDEGKERPGERATERQLQGKRDLIERERER
jgi:hypothetical protein